MHLCTKTLNFICKMWILQAEKAIVVRTMHLLYTCKLVNTLHPYSSVDSTITYQPLCLPLPQYCKSTKKKFNEYANFTIFSLSLFVSFNYFTGFTGKCCFSLVLPLFWNCSPVRSTVIGFVSFLLPNGFALVLNFEYFFVFNLLFFIVCIFWLNVG